MAHHYSALHGFIASMVLVLCIAGIIAGMGLAAIASARADERKGVNGQDPHET